MVRQYLTFLIILILINSCSTVDNKVLVPMQENQFTWIYQPKGDVFPGPNTPQLEANKFYDIWVANDHTFIQGEDGNWNIFGITHPIISTVNVHDGEFLSFHAKESESGFLAEKGFVDLPKVLPPDERPGEILQNHAPYIVKKDDLFYMVYGPSPIRLAVSKDLNSWQLKGELFLEEKGARDPSIIFSDGKYHILYCTERKVGMRTSTDLIKWSEPRIIFEAFEYDPESPSIVEMHGSFYLFVCSWNGVWDKKEIQGAYQHQTYVYRSETINDFHNKIVLTTLNSHAPEIFQHNNQWYISSVEWPNRGVSVDKLYWK